MTFKPGEEHWAWKGDQAKYRARHMRVTAARGRASAYECACGNQGVHWAQTHGTNGLDPQDYTAMCSHCHRGYDRPTMTGNRLAGEDRWNHVFTAADVEEIRARHGAWGESPTALAREYGVSKGAIDGIVYYRNWRNLNACVITTGAI